MARSASLAGSYPARLVPIQVYDVATVHSGFTTQFECGVRLLLDNLSCFKVNVKLLLI